MTDDRPFTRKPISDRVRHSRFGVHDCQIQSHLECDIDKCEVKRVLSRISEGQVRISVWATLASLLTSTLIALGTWVFHLWCSAHQVSFTIDWWEEALILAPFTGALIIRIREHTTAVVQPWDTNNSPEKKLEND